ncbi:MAG: methyltransferase domain-containing protein [Desulfovibrio sp.]|nr:methyltransferase domain-containing protein [Desulfovibrio sp.]
MPSLSELLKTIEQTFEVHFEPLKVGEQTFEVLTIDNMRQHLDGLLKKKAIKNPLHDLPLWAKVWPSSFVLGWLLSKYAQEGQSLLELGCGLGITGLLATNYPLKKIVISDVNAEALNFARANVLQNHLEDRLSVQRLDVNVREKLDDLPDFDLIIASELLYLKELHRPIIKLLEKKLKEDGTALFCTDFARRQPSFAKLAKRYLTVQESHFKVKSVDEEGQTENRLYQIYILTKTQAS